LEQLPNFPEFRDIELKDKKIFDDAFSKMQPQIAEYNFATLYTWRKVLCIKVTALYDNICLMMVDFHGQRIFSPFIGDNQVKASIDTFVGYMKKELKEVVLGFYTTQQLEIFKLNYPQAKIATDRDASDYVYNSSDLINLSGKKYDGKRNHIKKFKKLHQYQYFKLVPGHIKGCLDLLDRWYHQHCDNWSCSLSLVNETATCREALENYQILGLRGGIIEVDKKIVAFSLGEELNKNTLVIHFEKVDEYYQGLSAVINQEYAAAECAGYKYVNREEDLGEAGLRTSKMSYKPAYLVDKYCVLFQGR
jgi:uncharacterized protein